MSGFEQEAETIISGVRSHLEEAGAKLADVVNVHIPEVVKFLRTLEANPLVTAFRGAVPAPLSQDAMAILNGLAPLLGAMGGKVSDPAAQPEQPAPVSQPPAPGAVPSA